MSAAYILSGKWLANIAALRIKSEVESLTAKGKRAPGLAVILVGDNPASQAYVANKGKFAAKCGFKTIDRHLPAAVTQAEVLAVIKELNSNDSVDGILLQLPVPAHLNSHQLIDAIDPRKDADGLHPYNQGLLMRGGGHIRPCTPLGVLRLIDMAYAQPDTSQEDHDFDSIPTANLAGMRVVVIGRSILVGKPVALMLQERNATVTMAHSKTADIENVSRQADILIAAVGVPELVKSHWVKEGAIVIDVGINRVPSGKLVGDVQFSQVAPHTRAITPVPGGVGPMTVAMLIYNTLQSWKTK